MDQEQIVQEFMVHNEIPKEVFFSVHFDGSPIRLGDIGYQIIAVTPVDVYVCQGLREFDESLATILENMADGLELSDPFFGLEAAQHLVLDSVEANFAKACTRRIAHRSLSIAIGWVRNSQLGELARSAALDELALAQKGSEFASQDDEMEIEFPSIWQSRAFSSLHSVRVPDKSIRHIFDDISKFEDEVLDVSDSVVCFHWGDVSELVIERLERIQSLGAEVFVVPHPTSVANTSLQPQSNKLKLERRLRDLGINFFTNSSRASINLELEKILQVRSRIIARLA